MFYISPVLNILCALLQFCKVECQCEKDEKDETGYYVKSCSFSYSFLAKLNLTSALCCFVRSNVRTDLEVRDRLETQLLSTTWTTNSETRKQIDWTYTKITSSPNTWGDSLLCIIINQTHWGSDRKKSAGGRVWDKKPQNGEPLCKRREKNGRKFSLQTLQSFLFQFVLAFTMYLCLKHLKSK